MKQWQFLSYGDPSVLSLTDSPRPDLKAGHMEVQVSAISINPIDWKLMSGALRWIMPGKFPWVPCFDVAGTVVNPNNVPGFKNGDRVFVRLDSLRGGAAAEYVAVNPKVVAKIPDGLSFQEAAGIPLAGLTALQGLRDHGGLNPGSDKKRVLIIGASGGVGHYAGQIAISLGADVTAVCGDKNIKRVQSLGIKNVYDYQAKDLEQVLTDQHFDLILDCVGQKGTLNRWLRLLSKAGVFVTPVPTFEVFLRKLQFWRPGKIVSYFMKPNGSDLDFLGDLAKAGKLKTWVDSTFSMQDLPKAFEKSITGRAIGKIIITVS